MRVKRIFALFLALAMIFTLAACGKKEDPPKTETVTVSFDTDGGDEVPSQVISKGGAVVKPATPKKSGYIFDSWVLDGKTYEFGTAVNSDITLKAKWVDPNEGNPGGSGGSGGSGSGEGGSGGSGSGEGGSGGSGGSTEKVTCDSLSWVNGWYWVQVLCDGDPEVSVSPESARAHLKFTSSDPSIATVNDKGIVHGVKPGNVTITVKCGDKSASLPLEVRPDPNGAITLNTDHIVIDFNTQDGYNGLKIKQGGFDISCEQVTLTSSNESVAYVHADGYIAAIGLGHAEITATSKTGVTAKADVYVTGTIIRAYYMGEELNPNMTFLKGGTYQISIVEDSFYDYGLSKEMPISERCAIDAYPVIQFQQIAGQPYGDMQIKTDAESGSYYLVTFVDSVSGRRTPSYSILVK